MVLKILYAVGSTILPEKYYTHIVLAVVAVITLYTFAQGRKTNRERDLHGRTILITAGSYLEVILPGLTDGRFSESLYPQWAHPDRFAGTAWCTHPSSHF